MSFCRARTKRFNEEIGCAPGVGHYNPKVESKTNTVVFDKSSRFQSNKECSAANDSVFLPPRRLIKCGITLSTGSLHERFNRSSSSSLGSQECLLSKKQTHRSSSSSLGSQECLLVKKKDTESHSIKSVLDFTDVDTLQNELQVLLEQKAALEARCETNLDEIRYLNGQVNEKTLLIESLEKQLKDNLVVYTESLNKRISSYSLLEQKCNSLNVQYKEAQSKLADKAAQLELNTQLLNKKRSSYDLLEQKYYLLSDMYEKKQDELESKEVQLSNCKSSFDVLEKKFEFVSGELQSMQQQMEKLQEQWSQAVSSIQVLLSEKKGLEDTCENLKSDIVFKEESFAAMSAEINAMNQTLKLREAEQIKNQISITELKYQLDFIKTEFEKSQHEKQNLLDVIVEKESLIGELENRGVEVESTVAILKNQLEQKEQEFENLETKWLQCNTAFKDAANEIEQKDKRLCNLESSLVRCQDSLQQSLTEVANLSRQLCAIEDRLAQGSTSTELLKLEIATKDEQLEAAMESIRVADQKGDAQKDELQELAEELQTRTTVVDRLEKENQQLKNQSSEKWKQMYEKLEAKVAPFKDQLDAYASERESLIHENDQAFKELSDLADKYAKMMGHQNHKQKIQYLLKLKEEIIELKKENSRLRAIHTTPKKDMARKQANSAKKAPLKSMENTPAYF